MKPILPSQDRYEQRQFLKWIHERLVYVHGENPNMDYMLRLEHLAHPDRVFERIETKLRNERCFTKVFIWVCVLTGFALIGAMFAIYS